MSYVLNPILSRISRLAVARLAASLAFALPLALAAATSEISVDLKLEASDFVSGERIRGIVDLANSSPDRIGVGIVNVYDGTNENRKLQQTLSGKDRLLIEVFRANDMRPLTHLSSKPFVSAFSIESGEGQKLETFLADHFTLREPGRYLVRPVLAHRGLRYEGTLRAFDVVEGVSVGTALQLFSNRPGLQRNFELVYWSRRHSERLFLKSHDSGTSDRHWMTRELGPILRIDRKPTISVLPTGEIIIFHRLNPDQFIRTEFWSLPDALEFRTREAVHDPDSAGTQRVRELYKEGGVKPKTNPWWKFW